MPTLFVALKHANGRPAVSVRVQIKSLTQHDTIFKYTDSRGETYLETLAAGCYALYINNVHYGNFPVPGNISIRLR
jgi:hypothetical protein